MLLVIALLACKGIIIPRVLIMVLIIKIVGSEFTLIQLSLLVLKLVILSVPMRIVEVVAVALLRSVRVVRTPTVPTVEATLGSELLTTTALVVCRTSSSAPSPVEALIKRVLIFMATIALATAEWQIVLIGPASHPTIE